VFLKGEKRRGQTESLGSLEKMSETAYPDDVELLRRAQEGDTQALTELYLRYHAKVLNFIYRLVGDRSLAEDLTQETFVQVIRHLSAWRPVGSVSGWIHRIARNLVFNRFREERLAREISIDQPIRSESSEDPQVHELLIEDCLADPHAGPDKEAAEVEIVEKIQAALAKVALPYREALVLCDIQGYSYKEAAQIMGCPIDTVASRLARGRAKLAKLLGYLKKEIG
jgi:RNA polymerase sigma-70 factor (ECF subfamily)